METKFRFTFVKDKKVACPSCGQPQKFRRYFDGVTNEYLPDQYGICDRADKCGYHLSPYKDGYTKAIFLQENGHKDSVKCRWMPKAEKPISEPVKSKSINQVSIPLEVLKETLKGYSQNTFIQNLLNRVPYPLSAKDVTGVIELYRIGTITTGYMEGGTTFPFIDKIGNVRAIQVKQFDDKNHTTGTNFLHSILEKRYKSSHLPLPIWLQQYIDQDKRITCLFGEHLLSKYPGNPIGLVEAPKTAIYCTLYFGLPKKDTDLIWLAVYNKSSFTIDKVKALKGRFVYVFPDLSKDGSTYAEWHNKAKEFERVLSGTCFQLSTLLERLATDQDRQNGSDLADFIIKLDWRNFRKHDSDAIKMYINSIINDRDAMKVGVVDCFKWFKHYEPIGLTPEDAIQAAYYLNKEYGYEIAD